MQIPTAQRPYILTRMGTLMSWGRGWGRPRGMATLTRRQRWMGSPMLTQRLSKDMGEGRERGNAKWTCGAGEAAAISHVKTHMSGCGIRGGEAYQRQTQMQMGMGLWHKPSTWGGSNAFNCFARMIPGAVQVDVKPPSHVIPCIFNYSTHAC